MVTTTTTWLETLPALAFITLLIVLILIVNTRGKGPRGT
jgi:hypothetical protein